MKNKKSLTYITIIFLLGVMIAPNLNANIVQKNINQNQEAQVENSDNYGIIHGYVGVLCFPPPVDIVGAKLVLKGDFTIRITWSGLFGKYRFNNVEVGRQYTLTVTHPKYKTQSQTFTLLADEPDLKINFYMSKKDNARSKTIIEKIERLGSIYGNAGTNYIWGFSPVRFAKIHVGGKTTISSPIMGGYKITGLPLGSYIIIGNKFGYYTFTDMVTLTHNNPDKQVFIDLQPKDKVINEKLNQNKLVLHIINCFLSFIPSIAR